MNKYMTKDWKIKNGVCKVCKQNELQIQYEEALKQFPKDAIFMLVTDMHKGYINILPEYEDLAKQAIGDILDGLVRYEEEEVAVDKCVGDAIYSGYVEYA